MSVLLALLASLLWGTSDFLGGTASRKAPVASVLGLSQLIALVALVPVVVLAGELDADRGYVLPGACAGLVAMTALACFYRALSTGTMGVVAPVASLGVAVPVVVGLVTGESPNALQVVGIAVAVAGVVLASGPELRGTSGQGPSGRSGLAPLVLAAVAGVGFGGVLVLLAEGSESSTGMTLLTMRATSVVVLAVLFLMTVWRRGAGLGVPRSARWLVAGVAVGDVGANGAYGLATTRGGALLSITAVLASLYPVVTVLLARRFHAERLRRVQTAGVLAALVGVGLLAGG